MTATSNGDHTNNAGLPVNGGPSTSESYAPNEKTATATEPQNGVTELGSKPGSGPGAGAGAGPATGGPSAAEQGGKKPQLQKFSYSFFSPEIKHLRGIAIKILGMTMVIMTIIIWACLPVYWGSLWKANKYTNKLTVRVIDRDGGEVGSVVTQGLLAQTNLKYFITSPSEFPTAADVEHNIVQEGAWGAIIINAGATALLNTARQIGNSSYNGTSAIEVVYAQARNENAVGNYLAPYMQGALNQILSRYNAQSVAQYLGANANNATAINLLVTAPTTINNGIYYTVNNLRPYNQPVAAAITLVGLIYLLILSFIITMTNNAVREIIGPFMTTRSYLIYRIAAPLICYLPISFVFTMISLPFKIHFGAHFTYAGGFFLWWFSSYLGMAALGLSTEFAITIMGPRFIAFFLIPLIIVNVSVAALPHELQPWIYRYGAAMPFYNCGRIIRTIIFDTKNEIGKNIGILLGWIGVNIITVSAATWWFRRHAVNQHNKEVGENEMDSNDE
ncbi:hypothetical protein CI109_105957 [Kwoniella shandongensis]|uniref:Uncharacterized protein n=1 Tax=Kwoniella shandongensis TaxID=1734106 RepID=A0A5M6BY26_9TREE|nr:uncharacterized protein CI109_003995 [Kwoniella shandongensis]KAA5527736.1 hypothetical protein CI109_003995 [Kwoniella shandongensis]